AAVEINLTVVDPGRASVEDVDCIEVGMGIEPAEVAAISPGTTTQVEDSRGILETGHEPPARIERAAKPAIMIFGHRGPRGRQGGRFWRGRCVCGFLLPVPDKTGIDSPLATRLETGTLKTCGRSPGELRLSVSTLAAYDDQERPADDTKVSDQGPVLDIIE